MMTDYEARLRQTLRSMLSMKALEEWSDAEVKLDRALSRDEVRAHFGWVNKGSYKPSELHGYRQYHNDEGVCSCAW